LNLEEYNKINEALVALTDLTSFINERLRLFENQNKLLEVQRRMDRNYNLSIEKHKKWSEKKNGDEPMVFFYSY
jgi:hypothetical protein